MHDASAITSAQRASKAPSESVDWGNEGVGVELIRTPGRWARAAFGLQLHEARESRGTADTRMIAGTMPANQPAVLGAKPQIAPSVPSLTAMGRPRRSAS